VFVTSFCHLAACRSLKHGSKIILCVSLVLRKREPIADTAFFCLLSQKQLPARVFTPKQKFRGVSTGLARKLD
jgi:hypothetical protein